VIDITKMRASDTVIFGATVEVEDANTGDTSTYRIVGMEEIDVKNGMISFSSPIGRALLGRRVGEEVRVEGPRGQRTPDPRPSGSRAHSSVAVCWPVTMRVFHAVPQVKRYCTVTCCPGSPQTGNRNTPFASVWPVCSTPLTVTRAMAPATGRPPRCALSATLRSSSTPAAAVTASAGP
jgi:hypothetical protein